MAARDHDKIDLILVCVMCVMCVCVCVCNLIAELCWCAVHGIELEAGGVDGETMWEE